MNFVFSHAISALDSTGRNVSRSTTDDVVRFRIHIPWGGCRVGSGQLLDKTGFPGELSVSSDNGVFRVIIGDREPLYLSGIVDHRLGHPTFRVLRVDVRLKHLRRRSRRQTSVEIAFYGRHRPETDGWGWCSNCSLPKKCPRIPPDHGPRNRRQQLRP